jgi:hypothetical protein
MQVSSTLIAAQQAAREAQAKFHAEHVGPAKAGFSTALEMVGNSAEKFSPLPLKQVAPGPTPTPAAPPQPSARLGTMLDIKV